MLDFQPIDEAKTKPKYRVVAQWEAMRVKRPWMLVIRDMNAPDNGIGVADANGNPRYFDSAEEAHQWWDKNAKREGWLDEYPGVKTMGESSDSLSRKFMDPSLDSRLTEGDGDIMSRPPRTDRIGDQHAGKQDEPTTAQHLWGYEKTLSPMERGKALDALNKQVRNNGVFLAIKDLVQMKVAAGAEVQAHPKDGERLISPDGSYLTQKQLGKHAMGLAKYLSKHGSQMQRKFVESQMVKDYFDFDKMPGGLQKSTGQHTDDARKVSDHPVIMAASAKLRTIWAKLENEPSRKKRFEMVRALMGPKLSRYMKPVPEGVEEAKQPRNPAGYKLDVPKLASGLTFRGVISVKDLKPGDAWQSERRGAVDAVIVSAKDNDAVVEYVTTKGGPLARHVKEFDRVVKRGGKVSQSEYGWQQATGPWRERWDGERLATGWISRGKDVYLIADRNGRTRFEVYGSNVQEAEYGPAELMRRADTLSLEDALEKYPPTKTTVDWGTARGQGKRSGGMVKGAMSSPPRGKKSYTNLFGGLPDYAENKTELSGLESNVEREAYMRGRAGEMSHNQAMVYAYFKVGMVNRDTANKLMRESFDEVVEADNLPDPSGFFYSKDDSDFGTKYAEVLRERKPTASELENLRDNLKNNNAKNYKESDVVHMQRLTYEGVGTAGRMAGLGFGWYLRKNLVPLKNTKKDRQLLAARLESASRDAKDRAAFMAALYKKESIDEVVKAVRNLTADNTVVHLGPVGRFDVYVSRPKVPGLPDREPVPLKDYLASPATKNDPARMYRLDHEAFGKVLKDVDAKLLAAGIPRQRQTLIVRDLSQNPNPITGGETGGWWDRKNHAFTVATTQLDSDRLAAVVAHEWGHAVYDSLSKEAKKQFEFWFMGNVSQAGSEAAKEFTKDARMARYPVVASGTAVSFARQMFYADIESLWGIKPQFLVNSARIHAESGEDPNKDPLVQKMLAKVNLPTLVDAMKDDKFMLAFRTAVDEYIQEAERWMTVKLNLRKPAHVVASNRWAAMEELVRRWRAMMDAVDFKTFEFGLELTKLLQEVLREYIKFEKVSGAGDVPRILSEPQGADLRTYLAAKGITPSSYAAANPKELWAEVVSYMTVAPAQVSKALKKLVTNLVHGRVYAESLAEKFMSTVDEAKDDAPYVKAMWGSWGADAGHVVHVHHADLAVVRRALKVLGLKRKAETYQRVVKPYELDAWHRTKNIDIDVQPITQVHPNSSEVHAGHWALPVLVRGTDIDATKALARVRKLIPGSLDSLKHVGYGVRDKKESVDESMQWMTTTFSGGKVAVEPEVQADVQKLIADSDATANGKKFVEAVAKHFVARGSWNNIPQPKRYKVRADESPALSVLMGQVTRRLGEAGYMPALASFPRGGPKLKYAESVDEATLSYAGGFRPVKVNIKQNTVTIVDGEVEDRIALARRIKADNKNVDGFTAETTGPTPSIDFPPSYSLDRIKSVIDYSVKMLRQMKVWRQESLSEKFCFGKHDSGSTTDDEDHGEEEREQRKEKSAIRYLSRTRRSLLRDYRGLTWEAAETDEEIRSKLNRLAGMNARRGRHDKRGKGRKSLASLFRNDTE